MRIVECVPNFSEGRDEAVIKEITDVAGKKIAILAGDIHHTVFLELLENFDVQCDLIEVAGSRKRRRWMMSRGELSCPYHRKSALPKPARWVRRSRTVTSLVT